MRNYSEKESLKNEVIEYLIQISIETLVILSHYIRCIIILISKLDIELSSANLSLIQLMNLDLILFVVKYYICNSTRKF